MKKKGSIPLFLMIGLLIISAFLSVIAKPKVLSSGNFAIIFTTGYPDDFSFNDAAWQGKVMAEEKYGSAINIDYVYPKTIPEFGAYQDSLASLGVYDLIICVGFLQISALTDSAETYPDQKWVLIDDVLNKSNVKSMTFKQHEGSFLVGAMAGMVTKTNRLGFLGGMDIYLINKYLAGYTQGVQYINPDINVTTAYAPDPTNPFGDIPGGKVVGTVFYEFGCDVVYAAAGSTGIGVIQAANETEDNYAIGVDTDQDYVAPGSVLCSMLKLAGTAVFNAIDSIMQETWTADSVALGLAEGGVGISPMTYTQAERNGDFFFQKYCETKTRGEWIDIIAADIVDGNVVVADTPAGVPDRTQYEPCPTTEPTTTTEPTSTTEPTTITRPTNTTKPTTATKPTSTTKPTNTTEKGISTTSETSVPAISSGFTLVSLTLVILPVITLLRKRKNV